jgi:hypothetical protein
MNTAFPLFFAQNLICDSHGDEGLELSVLFYISVAFLYQRGLPSGEFVPGI